MGKYGGLALPSAPRRVQEANKTEWNEERSPDSADFYTIGYSGHDIETFIGALKVAGVVTLVDIRHAAVSQYKPNFSRRNLERHLARHRISYVHRGTLGVPRDIRGRALNGDSRDPIWKWYDEYVIPAFAGRNLHDFFNSVEHPVVLMCTEFDPTACHRHRLALALERHGLRGYDL